MSMLQLEIPRWALCFFLLFCLSSCKTGHQGSLQSSGMHASSAAKLQNQLKMLKKEYSQMEASYSTWVAALSPALKTRLAQATPPTLTEGSSFALTDAERYESMQQISGRIEKIQDQFDDLKGRMKTIKKYGPTSQEHGAYTQRTEEELQKVLSSIQDLMDEYRKLKAEIKQGMENLGQDGHEKILDNVMASEQIVLKTHELIIDADQLVEGYLKSVEEWERFYEKMENREILDTFRKSPYVSKAPKPNSPGMCFGHDLKRGTRKILKAQALHVDGDRFKRGSLIALMKHSTFEYYLRLPLYKAEGGKKLSLQWGVDLETEPPMLILDDVKPIPLESKTRTGKLKVDLRNVKAFEYFGGMIPFQVTLRHVKRGFLWATTEYHCVEEIPMGILFNP